MANLLLKKIYDEIKSKIGLKKEKPKLSIVQVGDDFASNTYIHHKIKAAKYLNINTEHLRFPNNISPEELIAQINKLNQDIKTNGILVQLPLPSHLDSNGITNFIDPRKDVDCLTSTNLGKLWNCHNYTKVSPT